jgi:hypothetical protein
VAKLMMERKDKTEEEIEWCKSQLISRIDDENIRIDVKKK